MGQRHTSSQVCGNESTCSNRFRFLQSKLGVNTTSCIHAGGTHWRRVTRVCLCAGTIMLAWSVGSKRWIINQAELLGPTVRMRARVNNNGYVNKIQWHTIYLHNDTSVYNNTQPLLWLQHTINFNLWLRQAAHFWLWNSAQVLNLAQVQRQYSVQVPSISIQYFFPVSVSVLVAPSIQYQYSTVQYVLFSSGKLSTNMIITHELRMN